LLTFKEKSPEVLVVVPFVVFNSCTETAGIPTPSLPATCPVTAVDWALSEEGIKPVMRNKTQVIMEEIKCFDLIEVQKNIKFNFKSGNKKDPKKSGAKLRKRIRQEYFEIIYFIR
jgi:hypothetical protein